ncbi:hypothetical protein [Spongiactinospora sp. TRM90649]|uniref:hypothetical protein n=1 Tax=Spongiactinospora sp. TRM90649 TaxID=3031114 RepID=UPI0023F833C0|nr:hypothetical protein [Spongiactinospora sp. TRM90649]MDF5755998.1 hypothetical protein [Spongiactinospora sp. TRM90649]
MSDDPAILVAQRYARGAIFASILIGACWHIGYDLTVTVLSLEVYRLPLLVAAAWLVYLAIGVAAAVALIRSEHPIRGVWGYAAGAMAVNVGVIAACPPAELVGLADWGWGSVGWLGLTLFWRRERHMRELVVFLALNGLITVAGMALTGTLDRVSLALFLMVFFGGVTLQVGASVGGHALVFSARLAAERSAEQARIEAAREIAEQVHADRLRRYEAVRLAAADLLTALASGADPADERIRRECAAGAARLRRLISETDDVPDPLLAELRAQVLDAERRDVMVAMEPPVGTIPELPPGVCQALTAAPSLALRGARGDARVTVYATPEEVIVSVVADTDDLTVAPCGHGVEVTQQREGRSLWIQSRWPGR